MRLLFSPLHLPSPQGGITLHNRRVVVPMCQPQVAKRAQRIGIGLAP